MVKEFPEKTRLVSVTLSQFCEADPTPRHLLRNAGFEIRENQTGRRLRPEELPEALQDADAVIAGVELYDQHLFASLPRLKCISRCGVGTDSIDLEAARRHGIDTLTTPDEVTEPVAQMTVAMILSLARNLPLHQEDSRKGVWQKRTGSLLSEWTIGLVGAGRIGRRVAQCLEPFGPSLLVHDPFVAIEQLPHPVTPCTLEELLTRTDVVSLHLARPQAEGALLKKEEFALMKQGSYLINTARGYLIDEPALEESIRSGHLAGAALDVFAKEPYRGPLSRYPQVLLTPHVATLTRQSRAEMERRAAQNVIDYFARMEFR